MNKPYSESCDQNKDVILSVIKPVLEEKSAVLEIGSGTGQHAVYFSRHLPHIRWHTSDCSSYLNGINEWINDADLPNVVAPVELNVSLSQWPGLDVDVIFTANTLHIMSQLDVNNFFSGAAQLLKAKSCLLIYGPFNYQGGYTSESNKRFDQWLKGRDNMSGIKHFEKTVSLANSHGFFLETDYEMPVNNRILHFIKA